MNGLWIGKTGNGNAWYHIYPFVMSKHTKKLHIVRYQLPQRNINDSKAIFHVFKSKSYFFEVLKFFITGFNVLRKNKIDYIVSFNLVPWASIAWLLSKIFRKPIIIGLIGNDFNKHINENRKNIYQYVINHTNIITVTGSHMMRYFYKKGFKNVFIFPHCLDNSYFSNIILADEESCDIISVSELIPRKRTIDIIRAVIILKQKGVFLKVKILGTGQDYDMLKSVVENQSLSDNIKFLGYQLNVLEHLKSAKIYIQASKKEGLSLGLIEAIGAGIVPITTQAGSEKDILTHNRDSLFFNIGDVEDLAEKIEYALEPTNYDRLLKNVYLKRQDLRIEKAISKTEAIQEYLLEIRKNPS